MRFLLSLLAVCALVVGAWFLGDSIGIDLSLVPSLIVALLVVTAMHLVLNRPRWRS